MDNKRIINKTKVELSNEEIENEKKYHKSRIMFAFVNNKLEFAIDDERDHQHWLSDVFSIDPTEFETLIRGYIKDFTILLYKSSSFLPLNDEEITVKLKNSLFNLASINSVEGVYTVYTGVKIGKIGEVWPPIKELYSFVVKHKYQIVRKKDNLNKFIAQFDGNTGFYFRTGILDANNKDTNVEPFMTEYPELIDVGIMGKCVCADKCNVDCYQKASLHGTNMSLSNYKKIIDESNGKTFQVALGGKGDPDTHENFEEILKYSADNNVVPNFTTSGICLTKRNAELCAQYCGAVAVSEHFSDYTDKAVKLLLDAGVKTNIHYVLSNKTIDKAIEILRYDKPYREGINALIFLLYKPIGLGTEDNVLKYTDNKVKEFFEAFDNRKTPFKIGFDSCSCSGIVNYSKTAQMVSVDYCEGGRFSMYISADMVAMPCSFANQDTSWYYKLDDKHTIKDAWDSDIFNKFRNILNNQCQGCIKKEYCGGGCPFIPNICLCEEKSKGNIHTI